MTRRLLSAALCLLACADPRPPKTPKTPAHVVADSAVGLKITSDLFGVVAMRGDTICLRTTHAAPPPARILVVVPDQARSFHADIGEELAACAGGVANQGEKFFRVNTSEYDGGALGIAILADSAVVSTGVHTDIDRDGVNESYHSCASSEGLHLTVWAGEPSLGRRLWHYYFYLGYDVEPDCEGADVTE